MRRCKVRYQAADGTQHRVPLVKDCIAYIEKDGAWKLEYYNRPCYVFKATPNPDRGRPRVIFTLTELRDAWKHGW